MSEPTNASEQPTGDGQELHTESHDPAVPAAYAAFMRTGWGDRELDLPQHPIAPHASRRRAALAEAFPGERLVLPAGTFKVRSNDTDYRFRSDTAHTYFCGNQTTDAVLVVEGGESVLYARPRSSRETDEFFRDRQYGELWAGRRPSLAEISDSLGLEVRQPHSRRRLGGCGTRIQTIANAERAALGHRRGQLGQGGLRLLFPLQDGMHGGGEGLAHGVVAAASDARRAQDGRHESLFQRGVERLAAQQL